LAGLLAQRLIKVSITMAKLFARIDTQYPTGVFNVIQL